MTKREFKDIIYNEIARTSKALANPVRMEIIDFIANGEKCVEDISHQLNINIANTSQHLQTLKKERLVKTRKEGHFILYSLSSTKVYDAWKALRQLTGIVNPFINRAVEQNREQNKLEEPLNYDDVKGRDNVQFLDVRPKDEFNYLSFPNAISIPLDELEKRMDELSKDKMIVTYCRGRYCLLADEAVQWLTRNGFRARKIEESVLDVELD